MTLDMALGVETRRGAIPWWAQEAMARRNSAIAELTRFYPSAEAVARELRRYAASTWRRDQALAEMPR